MIAPDFAILVYGSLADVEQVCAALPSGQGSEGIVVHHMPSNPHGWESRGEPVILLGIGAEGCAEVAKRCANGLGGVACVVLVGPEAPWAERCRHCGMDGLAKIDSDAEGNAIEAPCPWCNGHRFSLGPLEPLRAVAERARLGEMATVPATSTQQDGLRVEGTSYGRRYPLRLIITAHPEPAKCGGEGAYEGKPGAFVGCDRCGWTHRSKGTGKALGSVEIAAELGVDRGACPHGWESTGKFWFNKAGLTAIGYETRASHDAHAIADALKIALS